MALAEQRDTRVTDGAWFPPRMQIVAEGVIEDGPLGGDLPGWKAAFETIREVWWCSTWVPAMEFLRDD